MPSSQKKSYGSIVQARARRVLQGILEATKAGESSDPKKLQFRWQEEADSQKVTIETTLQTLMHATNQDGQAAVTTANVREALEAMRDFLGMLQDHRVKTKGEAQWNFTLTLSSTNVDRNLEAFDELWESKRSPKAKLQAVPEQSLRLGLKMGAPYPRVQLPDNFVPRVDAFDAVKKKLLAETDRALVVSAIAGLGGLGKSVLATALVLDAEVQTRFDDGILWVTLGQNPDLQNLLGDWIRTLDKSRESYSATTLEAASNYLHTLLLDKRMLLVVDDVWNGAHVELFRVGGAQCRVLMTTREAQIEGADYHALSLMTEAEAIALVRQKLDRQWQPEQEPEVKAFAKSLGYLPLALDLATNQVRDGLSWADLRSEFEIERRAVALEVLDSSEAWDCLDENQQRKYSLRACFNLSLRRLSAEQLRQFAWLGVLPEDVSMDARMAVTLWELSPLKAKKALIDLRNRSFLTSGTETLEGEVTYRVHDLMHDTARGLIEQATLSDSIRTLADAHAQLLDRYRQKCDRWDRLPNDGYIHRHLTWHFQQAGREDEIHALMAMSDEQGRNAWFEACDRLGQPAIFVQDVKRGWAIAEQSYEQDSCRSIVLQCRYALITATLNSLVENLPAGMMAEFVKRQYWTPVQAWAYVEQMQDDRRIAEAIEKLASYLPKSLSHLAIEKARSILSESMRAEALKGLAEENNADLTQPLKAARPIQNESMRTEALRGLLEGGNADLTQLLGAARSIKDKSRRARILRGIAQIDNVYFAEALEAARSIQDESRRAWALREIAQIDNVYFAEALKAARSIQSDSGRATALRGLAEANNVHFAEALKAARSIQDESKRARALSTLAQIDNADLTQLLETARSIQDKDWLACALIALAQIDDTYFAEALEAARIIQNEEWRAGALILFAQTDNAYFAEALEAARLIQNESRRAWALMGLAQVDNADLTQLLEAARSIQDEFSRITALIALAQIDDIYLTEALEAARAIQNEGRRTGALILFAQTDNTYFAEALEAARAIQDESKRTEALIALAQIDNAYFAEALEAARAISVWNEYWLTKVLIALAQIDNAYFAEALERTRVIQNEGRRIEALSILAQIDNAHFLDVLGVARAIQNEDERTKILISLAKELPESFLPQAFDLIYDIAHKPPCTKALSAYLPRISIDQLSFPDWQFYLHLLAHRTRADLMQDLATLYPAIVHLGGTAAVRGMVDAMRDVCNQWK